MNSHQIRSSDKHAFAVLNGVSGSCKKINIVLDAIRGKTAKEALETLDLIPKKHSLPVGKLIKSAVSNAINKGLTDDLLVEHIYSTKANVIKKIFFKGRGRTGINKKPYSHITVVVRANEKVAIEKELSDGSKK